MGTEASGGNLFIIHNSISNWTGLRYLEEWTELAKSFDIATGFFEIGALLAPDGKWQQLDKIRILMGAEMTSRTRKALLDTVKSRVTQTLNQSIEDAKTNNSFLNGTAYVLDALQRGSRDRPICDKVKFPSEANIKHAKREVIAFKAFIGSGNVTNAGMMNNVELNISSEKKD